MRKIIALMLVMAMMGSIAACGGDSSSSGNEEASSSQKGATTESDSKSADTATNKEAESIVLMYQGLEPEQNIIIAVTEKFMAETGKKIELIYAPHDTYQEQLSGSIVGGNVPDIFMLDGPFLPNLVWSGVSARLDEYIDPAIIDDMTASNIAQCTYPVDGNLYAIGPQDSAVVLYGNKTYLEKIGARIPTTVEEAWTIDEFENYLKALSELEEVTFPLDIMRSYGVKSEWGTYGFYPALISGGGGIINRDTWVADGMLNSQATIDVLEKFQKWSNNGWLVPENAGGNMMYNETKDAALAWCGTWFYPAAEAALGEELVVMPLPDFGQGVKSPNATWIYSISATASEEKKVLAGEFLSFMLKDDDYLRGYQEELGAFPGLKSWAANYPLYNDGKLKIATAQAASTAIVRPPHPAYPTITSAFMSAFGDILDGADIKATLDKAAAEIDEDIEDNDGYPPFGE